MGLDLILIAIGGYMHAESRRWARQWTRMPGSEDGGMAGYVDGSAGPEPRAPELRGTHLYLGVGCNITVRNLI